MATIEKNGAFMALPMNIKRGNPIPIDTTLVWYSKEELDAYAASGTTAYVGQIVTLVDEEHSTAEVYMISNEAGTLVKLAQTTASGDLAGDVSALQLKVNTLINTVGEEASEGKSATGIFATIAELVAADTAISDRTEKLEATHAKVGGAGADKDNFKTVAQEIQASIDALKLDENYAAKDYENIVNTLVGSDTGKSVDTIVTDKIADVIAGAPESFDTLKEIADWIMSDTTGAAKMAADIDKLKAIVAGIGGEGQEATVVAYVTKQIEALNIGQYAKTADLGTLAEKSSVAEADLDSALAAKITGKTDKVVPQKANNIAILSSNGSLKDSNKQIDDFATAQQGIKAETAIQDIVAGTGITTDGDTVLSNIPYESLGVGGVKFTGTIPSWYDYTKGHIATVVINGKTYTEYTLDQSGNTFIFGAVDDLTISSTGTATVTFHRTNPTVSVNTNVIATREFASNQANEALASAQTYTNEQISALPAAGITSQQITNWDTAVDSIDEAVQAGVATLDYTDTAVAGQYVSSVSQTDGVISVTHVALPTATAAALGMVKVDNTSIGVDASGTISVKAVNVQKLYVAEGDELVLDGGGA